VGRKVRTPIRLVSSIFQTDPLPQRPSTDSFDDPISSVALARLLGRFDPNKVSGVSPSNRYFVSKKKMQESSTSNRPTAPEDDFSDLMINLHRCSLHSFLLRTLIVS